MAKKEFEKFDDEEKLSFYDKEIPNLITQLEYEESDPFHLPGEDRELKSRQLQRKIDNLHADRKFVLDRLALGLSKKNTSKKSNQIFIASWFDPSTDASITAIEEGIREAGFEPKCVKDEHFSEHIIDKPLGEIRKSRLLVVDLTGKRSSVFFEAGFALGSEIETIYVYKKDTEKADNSLEFYVKHYKCYSYSTPEELKEKIKDIISARIKFRE